MSRFVSLYNLQCGFFSTTSEKPTQFQFCIFSPTQRTSFFNLERKQLLNPYFKRTNHCVAKILLAYRPPFPKQKQKFASIKHIIPKYIPSLPYCVTQGNVPLNRRLSIRFWVIHVFLGLRYLQGINSRNTFRRNANLSRALNPFSIRSKLIDQIIRPVIWSSRTCKLFLADRKPLLLLFVSVHLE